MGGRTLPMECPHGRVMDWGDFGPDDLDGSVGSEHCPQCEDERPRRFQLGWWCPRGGNGGHPALFHDPDASFCGAKGWPLVIEVDPDDVDLMPEWAWEL